MTQKEFIIILHGHGNSLLKIVIFVEKVSLLQTLSLVEGTLCNSVTLKQLLAQVHQVNMSIMEWMIWYTMLKNVIYTNVNNFTWHHSERIDQFRTNCPREGVHVTFYTTVKTKKLFLWSYNSKEYPCITG